MTNESSHHICGTQNLEHTPRAHRQIASAMCTSQNTHLAVVSELSVDGVFQPIADEREIALSLSLMFIWCDAEAILESRQSGIEPARESA